jgi:hypothetical protein
MNTRCVNTNTPFSPKNNDNQRRWYGGGEAGVGPKHDLLERGRRHEQRERQLNGGLGGAETAEDGERPEVGSSLAPGLQCGVATSRPRWRRVARSTRASPGASLHCRPGLGVSVQGRGWSCGHAGSPRRSAITRKMATGVSPPGIASEGDRRWGREGGCQGVWKEGAEPCTVNAYTVVLSSIMCEGCVGRLFVEVNFRLFV